MILCGCFVGLTVYALSLFNAVYRPLWRITGQVRDEGAYLVYLPDGLQSGKKYPLVYALSPNADAMSMLNVWASAAEEQKWIVAASKTFQNGQRMDALLQDVLKELHAVEKKYPVDTRRVVFSGMSGGGMGSHGFAKFYPAELRAIVVNTGMMAEGFDSVDYPNGKLAVLIASPTDFRYDEMRRDRTFLQAHNWKTYWLEFSGGHALAPPEIYVQAAQWLEQKMK